MESGESGGRPDCTMASDIPHVAFLTRLVRVSLTKHDKVLESLNSLTEHSHTFLDLSVWIAVT